MINKAKYKEFFDYLTEGADQIIQSNRDNLEKYIRDSIDINKSSEIIKKHRKENDNFVVSPEVFLALSLVDDIPSRVDLRFVPEFKLDGVIFKNYRTVGTKVTSIKVPYCEKVYNFLKLQINPNSEIEMSRSGKYAENIINNMKSFDKIFRDEMKMYPHIVFKNQRKYSPFLEAIITCIRPISTKEHPWINTKYQIEFFLEFNRLKEAELTPQIAYKTIIKIILRRVFPKLLGINIDKIISTSLDMGKQIDYHAIYEIIDLNYNINPDLCRLLEDCRRKLKNKKETFLHNNLCLGNKPLQEILTQVPENNQVFFNLILFISKCRKNISRNNKSSYAQLLTMCFDVTELRELKAMGDSNDSSVPLIDIYPRFYKHFEKSGRDFNKALIERFLKSIYTAVPIYELNKDFLGKKYKVDENGVYKYTDEFAGLINKNNVIVEFCKNQNAWNKNANGSPIYEITSGEPLLGSGINGKGVLKFLFNDQVDDDFFQNVQYILFHENLIIVSKNGELSSLLPSEGYKQFVLKTRSTIIERSMIEDSDDVQLNRFTKILDGVLRENSKEHFDNQSGDDFIERLGSAVGIKFTNTIEVKNDDKTEQHKLSWGSISETEQEYFINFLNDFSFIFPKKISEIHLSNILPKKRSEIPIDQKELFFYIEKQKEDRSMDAKFFITQEDLILLSRSKFYITIMVERAFCVIFNKEILNSDGMYAEFKNAIGNKNIEIAEKYFRVRGKSIADHQLFRKIFVQNGMLFIQGKKEQLSGRIIDFMNGIFHRSKQLAIN